jgi:hypothetical protein
MRGRNVNNEGKVQYASHLIKSLPTPLKSYLRCIQKLEEVSKFSKDTRVILVSTPSLDGGFSQALLRQLGNDPNVLIILPERGGHATLARQLFDEWDNRATKESLLNPMDGLRGEVQLNMNIPYTVRSLGLNVNV